MKKSFGILMAMLFVGMMFSSCEKEKTQYQVRIQNEMYSELLGIPFMKYDVKEFTLGDIVFSAVPYGQFSAYKSIESSTDYAAKVTYEMFTYNAETFMWESDGTFSADLGTISWVDDEDYAKHKIKLHIGGLLDLYEPEYEKFAEQ
jgi:hypothetical protein